MERAIFTAKNAEILKAMHLIMQNMNHEDAYLGWIVTGVPDEPTEFDFFDIAEDEEYRDEAFKTFARMIEEFGEHGIVWYG